jgi:8-oxo-dGTP diphosphatase
VALVDKKETMTTEATLCYIFSGSDVLLQKKGDGLFGAGKWNAPGGKVEMGETTEQAAIREVYEETGLIVEHLRFMGNLYFYFESELSLDQVVYVFTTNKFSGSMRPGREGALKWFSIEELPYEEMWEDDRVWLPELLKGNTFTGKFYFTKDYGSLLRHEFKIEELS